MEEASYHKQWGNPLRNTSQYVTVVGLDYLKDPNRTLIFYLEKNEDKRYVLPK